MLDGDFLVEPGDVEAMSARIVRVLQTPAMLSEARLAARQAAERFRWEEIARATAAAYEERLVRLRSRERRDPARRRSGGIVIAEPIPRSPQPATTTARPRIALVAHGIHDGGGMERATAELVKRVHERVNFVVFSSELAPDLRTLVEWRRIRVPERPIPLRILLFFVRVALPLARARVDLVHMLGAIAPNRTDVVTVHYCHAGSLAKTGRLAPLGASALRRLNRTVARAMAIAAERFCYRPARTRLFASVSQGVRLELEQHYPGIPVVITPNGVDLERFRPDAGGRSALRNAEGVGDEPVCLFVGGDWDRKGLGVAISALASVRDQAPMRLWVVGRGQTARFRELAEGLGVAERVRFFGPRADTERFYGAADIFVLPTEYEAAPLVAYEASAAGLPVVAARVNGIEELIVDGRSGIIVERTARSVADALLRLAADPELRVRMGHEAHRRAAAYTWQRSADSVEAAYDRLLGGTRAAIA